jgi:hypothetical protein
VKIAQCPPNLVSSSPRAPAPTPIIPSPPQTLATVYAKNTVVHAGVYGPTPSWLNHPSNSNDKAIALSLLRFFSNQIAEHVVPHHQALATTLVKSVWIGCDFMKYRAELRTTPANHVVNSLKRAGLAVDLAETIAAGFNVHGLDSLVANVHFGLDQVQNGLTGRAVFEPLDIQKWALQLQGEGASADLIDVVRALSTK